MEASSSEIDRLQRISKLRAHQFRSARDQKDYLRTEMLELEGEEAEKAQEIFNEARDTAERARNRLEAVKQRVKKASRG